MAKVPILAGDFVLRDLQKSVKEILGRYETILKNANDGNKNEHVKELVPKPLVYEVLNLKSGDLEDATKIVRKFEEANGNKECPPKIKQEFLDCNKNNHGQRKILFPINFLMHYYENLPSQIGRGGPLSLYKEFFKDGRKFREIAKHYVFDGVEEV